MESTPPTRIQSGIFESGYEGRSLFNHNPIPEFGWPDMDLMGDREMDVFQPLT
jgi:hypothetical protein